MSLRVPRCDIQFRHAFRCRSAGARDGDPHYVVASVFRENAAGSHGAAPFGSKIGVHERSKLGVLSSFHIVELGVAVARQLFRHV